jgi:predicted nucleic acid-binding protein
MPTYFADAWFLIALFDRRDSHHRIAHRISRELSTHSLVTHDAVLTEVLSYFSDEGTYARSIAVEGIRGAIRSYDVLSVDRELFLAGLDRYAARPDKEYSHIDCMSMVLMERLGITHVLTNDHHFAQAGFIVVNQ